MFDLAEIDKIRDAFKVRRKEHTLQARQEIWDAPLIFGMILLLIFTEWIVRKIVRLV